MIPQFPIKVYFDEDFQVIESREVYENLLKEYRYIQAAGGVVYDKSGRVLMIFRRGRWDFPKGKVEFGEKIEDAALREVEEETGVKAHIVGTKRVSVFHTYDTYGEKMLKETFWFEMEADFSSELKPQSEEDIAQAVFVEPVKIEDNLKNSYASLREMWNQMK